MYKPEVPFELLYSTTEKYIIILLALDKIAFSGSSIFMKINSCKIITRMKNWGTWLRKQTVMVKLLRKTDQGKAMDLIVSQKQWVLQHKACMAGRNFMKVLQDKEGLLNVFFLSERTSTEQNRWRTCEFWNLGPAEKNILVEGSPQSRKVELL